MTSYKYNPKLKIRKKWLKFPLVLMMTGMGYYMMSLFTKHFFISEMIGCILGTGIAYIALFQEDQIRNQSGVDQNDQQP